MGLQAKLTANANRAGVKKAKSPKDHDSVD